MDLRDWYRAGNHLPNMAKGGEVSGPKGFGLADVAPFVSPMSMKTGGQARTRAGTKVKKDDMIPGAMRGLAETLGGLTRGAVSTFAGGPADIINMFSSGYQSPEMGNLYDMPAAAPSKAYQIPYGSEYFKENLPFAPTTQTGKVSQELGGFVPLPVNALPQAFKAGSKMLGPAMANLLEKEMKRSGMMMGVAPEGGAPKARELKGALAPTKDPVRGETSKELRKQQKEQLTDVQKEKLERVRQTSPDVYDATKFMTPMELGKILADPDSIRKMDRLLNVLPSAKQLASVAKAGEPKRGWYRASTQALIDVFGVQDAPRFASLLAAMSPQTSVEMNLLNTLNTWKNWTAAGRPVDPSEIRKIMGASVAGTKGEESVLEAWANNSVRALTARDPTKVTLSGPKVDSFYKNLTDDVYKVTNDAWMASGMGVDQGLFSGSPSPIQLLKGDPGLTPGYIGASARTREAGQKAGMYPSEAQETTWSTFMPLYEMQRATGLPAREILQRGLLTPDVIRGTPDFATLLGEGKYGSILGEAGYGEQLAGLKPTPFSSKTQSLSLGEQRDLENVAERLESLRDLRGMESRGRVFPGVKIDKETGEIIPPESAFAYSTHEYVPGRGTGHLEDLIDAPFGSRSNFSSRVSSAFRDPQGLDIMQQSVGLKPIATRSMTGAFRPSNDIPYQGTLKAPDVGRQQMEISPGFASGVEVPLIPNTKTGDLEIPANIQRQLTGAEAGRGYMTAQRGSPWHAMMPNEQGGSLVLPLEKKADPEKMGLTSALLGGEYDLADTGAGVSVLNFGDVPAIKDADRLSALMGSKDAQRATQAGDYINYGPAWEQKEGSGAATRQFLDIYGGLRAPEKQGLSAGMQEISPELLEIYQSVSKSKKMPTREDLMNALRIIRDKGVPGLIAALAAGEALPAEQEKRKGGLAHLSRTQAHGRG